MSSRRAMPRALRPAALALAVTLAAGCVTTEYPEKTSPHDSAAADTV